MKVRKGCHNVIPYTTLLYRGVQLQIFTIQGLRQNNLIGKIFVVSEKLAGIFLHMGNIQLDVMYILMGLKKSYTRDMFIQVLT